MALTEQDKDLEIARLRQEVEELRRLLQVERAARPRGRLASIVGTARGTYGRVKEIDDYLRAERDSWSS